MKRLSNFILLVVILLTFGGCASTPAKFNTTYLPNAIPNNPVERIVLAPDDNDLIAKYRRKPIFSNDIGLFWLAADSLYLNLEGSGIYVVSLSTKNIKKMTPDEEKDVKQLISQKIVIDSAQKEGLLDLAVKVVSYLFSYFGQEYTGKIIDNNQEIQFYIQTAEKRGDTFEANCVSAKLRGKLTSAKGQVVNTEWDYSCDWLPQTIANKKVPQLLRKLQISPSGKYYLYENILYRLGKNGASEDLIANYPYVISLSVNPNWTKIAVLRGKGGKYWIEFFDIRIES
jgi:hypothetical protein